MKYSNLSIKELLEMQKKFRRGQLKEENIKKDELKDLKLLYYMQIKYLKSHIKE